MTTTVDPTAAGPATADFRKQAARDWVVRRGWLAWGIIVLFVSVAPVGWVFGLTPEVTWSLLGGMGHFFEFGLFAALVATWRAAAVPGSSGYLAGALGGVGYGLAIEVIQLPIPYRSADPRDVAVDMAGVAVALALLVLVRRRARPGLPARAVDGYEEVPS
jgi:VanZ family protein